MRSLMIFFGIFASIGAICLLVALFFTYKTVTKISSWQEAPATLVGFDRNSNNPTVEFSYNNQKIQFHSTFSSSDMETGQTLQVHFPPGEPEGAEIKNFFMLWFLPLFLGIFALTFGGVGFFGLSRQMKKLGAKRELFDNQKGKKLSLPISDITQDTSFKVNGRSPYIVITQWVNPLTNVMHEFKSDYVWYHPGTLLGNQKQMDVYIDENDPKRYYMDTTFLPKKAN